MNENADWFFFSPTEHKAFTVNLVWNVFFLFLTAAVQGQSTSVSTVCMITPQSFFSFPAVWLRRRNVFFFYPSAKLLWAFYKCFFFNLPTAVTLHRKELVGEVIWSHLTPLNVMPLCVYPLTTQMITDGPTVGILPASFLLAQIKPRSCCFAHKSADNIVFTPGTFRKSCVVAWQYTAPLRGQPFLSPQCLKVWWENNSWKAVITGWASRAREA